MNRTILFAFVLMLLLAAWIAVAQDEMEPAEAFFRNIEFSDVQMSPDGRLLSALSYSRTATGVRNIVVIDIETGGGGSVTNVGRDADTADISSFFWANDERLVMKIDRYLEDPNQPRQYLGTFSVNYLGSDTIALHRPESLARIDSETGTADPNAIGNALLDMARVPGQPDFITVSPTGPGIDTPHLHRVNVNTGEIVQIATNPGNVRRWLVDNQARWRGAIRDTGSRHQLTVRSDDDEGYRVLLEYVPGDVHVYGFDEGDDALWIASRINRDRFALYRLGFSDSGLGEPVHEDERYDVYFPDSRTAGLVQDRDGEAIYLEYMGATPITVFLSDDPTWRQLQLSLNNALPSTANSIVQWTEDRLRFLVHVWGDQQPGEYFIYSPAEEKLVFQLARVPWLRSNDLVPMRPIEVEARDGMPLEGYLLLPKSGGDSHEMIVLPHNRPFAGRSEWGFDAEAQFFANRGYAVLRVNYRGSTGYGRQHLEAGYREWGLKMQDDIADAVRWAIEQGHANREQICIFGTGYGGYASIMAGIRDPDLFNCVISYNGFADLWLLHRQILAGERFPDPVPAAIDLDLVLGDPVADASRFSQGSPTTNVDRIEADMFLIYDRKGLPAPRQHFDDLSDSLKAARQRFEKYSKRSVGKDVWGEDNRVELYLKLEQYFQRKL